MSIVKLGGLFLVFFFGSCVAMNESITFCIESIESLISHNNEINDLPFGEISTVGSVLFLLDCCIEEGSLQGGMDLFVQVIENNIKKTTSNPIASDVVAAQRSGFHD